MILPTRLVIASIRKSWAGELRRLPAENRGRHTLRCDNRYCALGVLSDMWVRKTKLFEWEDISDWIEPENLYGQIGYALRRVNCGLDIRGLSRELQVVMMMTDEEEGKITSLNDEGASFEAIADDVESVFPTSPDRHLPDSLAWHYAPSLLPEYIPDPGIPVAPLPVTFEVSRKERE